METVEREDGWWITGVPDCMDCGPYPTRAMADDDMRGMARYHKYSEKPGWFSVTSPSNAAK